MKNFIFAMCGFLMMSLVSLSVQASSVESPKCEYVNPSVDVGLPDIPFIILEAAPVDGVVLTMTHPVFLVANNPAMMCSVKEETAIQEKRIEVPKYPFRYIYKSKYCTNYSHTAYSRLITPY
ncbi:hypothetical protein [uncultured Parabacteroides sp.]|uniref:hypothetical protein n=1 Tax=uncultured Parabacteroides sp. TaxID=512312 RepID=UPI00280480C4|nr:hypothetical protein [uncultured Parabacteroides sp.]